MRMSLPTKRQYLTTRADRIMRNAEKVNKKRYINEWVSSTNAEELPSVPANSVDEDASHDISHHSSEFSTGRKCHNKPTIKATQLVTEHVLDQVIAGHNTVEATTQRSEAEWHEVKEDEINQINTKQSDLGEDRATNYIASQQCDVESSESTWARMVQIVTEESTSENVESVENIASEIHPEQCEAETEQTAGNRTVEIVTEQSGAKGEDIVPVTDSASGVAAEQFNVDGESASQSDEQEVEQSDAKGDEADTNNASEIHPEQCEAETEQTAGNRTVEIVTKQSGAKGEDIVPVTDSASGVAAERFKVNGESASQSDEMEVDQSDAKGDEAVANNASEIHTEQCEAGSEQTAGDRTVEIVTEQSGAKGKEAIMNNTPGIAIEQFVAVGDEAITYNISGIGPEQRDVENEESTTDRILEVVAELTDLNHLVGEIIETESSLDGNVRTTQSAKETYKQITASDSEMLASTVETTAEREHYANIRSAQQKASSGCRRVIRDSAVVQSSELEKVAPKNACSTSGNLQAASGDSRCRKSVVKDLKDAGLSHGKRLQSNTQNSEIRNGQPVERNCSNTHRTPTKNIQYTASPVKRSRSGRILYAAVQVQPNKQIRRNVVTADMSSKPTCSPVLNVKLVQGKRRSEEMSAALVGNGKRKPQNDIRVESESAVIVPKRQQYSPTPVTPLQQRRLSLRGRYTNMADSQSDGENDPSYEPKRKKIRDKSTSHRQSRGSLTYVSNCKLSSTSKDHSTSLENEKNLNRKKRSFGLVTEVLQQHGGFNNMRDNQHEHENKTRLAKLLSVSRQRSARVSASNINYKLSTVKDKCNTPHETTAGMVAKKNGSSGLVRQVGQNRMKKLHVKSVQPRSKTRADAKADESNIGADEELKTQKRKDLLATSETYSDEDTDQMLSESDIEPDSDDVIDDECSQGQKSTDEEWHVPCGLQKKFTSIVQQQRVDSVPVMDNADPISFYTLFLNDEVVDLMVRETNRYAAQSLSNKTFTQSSRMLEWVDTDADEMRKFCGLLLWMGLLKMPSLDCYWRRSPLYRNNIASEIMTRNQFQLLLANWHFANNEDNTSGNRIHKVNELMQKLVSSFAAARVPDEDIVIDETVVPFRGRLQFRQYLPGKAHKYGVKVFKLCDKAGYTYNMSIYKGKTDRTLSLPHEVAMHLCTPYLNAGRTLVTDNFYTSLPLAQSLLDSQTHLVGTVRPNRIGLPRPVTGAKLKKGELIARENSSGILVLKWKDKRDVLMLSTRHNDKMADVGKLNRNQEIIRRPEVVMYYNSVKQGIDVSDQMSSYQTAVRKSIRWFHKIAVEFLLGTAVVNAWLLYNKHCQEHGMHNKKLQIASFREELVMSLLNLHRDFIHTVDISEKHYLQNTEKCSICDERLQQTDEKEAGKRCDRRKRRYCIGCYNSLVESVGRSVAKIKARRVTTQCRMCPGKPYMCFTCFPQHHADSSDDVNDNPTSEPESELDE